MFFPIRTDSPLRNTPYMNWVIIAANVVMYVVQLKVWGDPAVPGHTPTIALWPQDAHLYQFFGYMFLHGGVMHLLGNMLFLYVFGNNVNEMGHIGYLGYYLAGGVCAGIFFMFFGATGPRALPLVGASGAIFAVVGAYMILFPRANVTIVYFFLLIGTFELASLWFILAWPLYLVVMEAMNGGGGTSHTAHFGGLIFGCLVCYALLATHLLPRDQFDVVALVRQWNRRRQYRDAVAGGWNPYQNPAPAGAATAGAGGGGGGWGGG